MPAVFVFRQLYVKKGDYMSTSKRISGIIKWYHTNKHFGYLLADNREVFFHIDDCGDFTPEEGLMVDFEPGFDNKGRAKAIRITECVTVGVCDGTNYK
jgi:cold shock CspA family protein